MPARPRDPVPAQRRNPVPAQRRDPAAAQGADPAPARDQPPESAPRATGDHPNPTPFSPPVVDQPGQAVTSGGDNLGVQETLPAPDDATENSVDLARIAWSITTLGFLLAMVVLVLRGDIGYAGVTLAVAVAAAINLF